MMRILIFALWFASFGTTVSAQTLRPGFDPAEYKDVLLRCAGGTHNILFRGNLPREVNFVEVYNSPEMGMHNKYRIWLSKDKSTIAVNLRGTTGDLDSWVENFYAAMIPATGSLQMSDSFRFNYKFASDSKAMVHAGWTIGIASLLPDILNKLDAFYKQGIRQVIVEGHSQGGALAFLLSAYLHYRIQDGTLPADLVIKTYCSAAPKPGNTYFAYDFDNYNREGWAFNVVNAADWVPETPFSIQTITDFNPTNPFTHARRSLKKQKKLLVRYYTTHIFNRMDHTTRKAQRVFSRHLGHTVFKQVKKSVPAMVQPVYTSSSDYMPAGTPIILEPGPDYYRQFPDTGANIFRNHLFEPYYYLVQHSFK